MIFFLLLNSKQDCPETYVTPLALLRRLCVFKLLKSPEISADFKQMQRVLTAHSLPCERGIVCEADAWFRRAH